MKTVNTHEAKTHFSALLKDLASGEEVIIAKAGKPVAKLVRYEDSRQRVSAPGSLQSESLRMDETFDLELDDVFDVLADQSGR
jgi:prevent-host-death family protein